MRYAVLSDIHGNLPALEAALAFAARQGVDRYLCLGDIVGFGPQPNECVQRVAALDAASVAGNHELLVLGLMPLRGMSPYVRESVSWTRSVLEPASAAFLSSLPLSTSVSSLTLAHGSLRDPYEYVLSPEQATAQLGALPHGSSLLLLGHTHQQWAFSLAEGTLLRAAPGRVLLPSGQRLLLNPGSVGQSRDELAECRFLILDEDGEQATFHSIGYDVQACQIELERKGRPPDAHHRWPRPARRTSGLARLWSAARSRSPRSEPSSPER